jgi:hypothetical protein
MTGVAEFEVLEDDTPLGKFVYEGFAERFQPRVEEIAGTFDRQYAGVIRSTPTHTRVVCTAGPLAETYVRGTRGTETVNEECHEACCERVHDTGEEVHIPGAEADEEWVGAEEFEAFGLRSYYGVPPVRWERRRLGRRAPRRDLRLRGGRPERGRYPPEPPRRHRGRRRGPLRVASRPSRRVPAVVGVASPRPERPAARWPRPRR